MSTKLTVTGMACEACEETVVGALEDVAGVEHATADRTSDVAIVEGTADPAVLAEAVEDEGYTASP